MGIKPGKTVRTGFGDEPAKPTINYQTCTNCMLCAKICPSRTLADVDGKIAVAQPRQKSGMGCIGCGQCMAVCPSGSVGVLGRRMEPADVWKIDKNNIATPEQLEHLLYSRRSVRHFTDKLPDKKLLDAVISAAASAPMGMPPWDVSVTTIYGHTKVQQFADDMIKVFKQWKMVFSAPIMPAWRLFLGKPMSETMSDFVLPIVNAIVDERAKGNDRLFYNAPALMLFHGDPHGDATDGLIACTYAMIAAQSRGLGTCMIGTVPPAFKQAKWLKTKWGVPAANNVAMAMIIGYSKYKFVNGVKRRFASTNYVE